MKDCGERRLEQEKQQQHIFFFKFPIVINNIEG